MSYIAQMEKISTNNLSFGMKSTRFIALFLTVNQRSSP
jgi:hypothetical protein